MQSLVQVKERYEVNLYLLCRFQYIKTVLPVEEDSSSDNNSESDTETQPISDDETIPRSISDDETIPQSIDEEDDPPQSMQVESEDDDYVHTQEKVEKEDMDYNPLVDDQQENTLTLDLEEVKPVVKKKGI